jgi:hypothetical protein
MYLTKYQNLRIGFQAYFKNIPRKSHPPLKSQKMNTVAPLLQWNMMRLPDHSLSHRIVAITIIYNSMYAIDESSCLA